MMILCSTWTTARWSTSFRASSQKVLRQGRVPCCCSLALPSFHAVPLRSLNKTKIKKKEMCTPETKSKRRQQPPHRIIVQPRSELFIQFIRYFAPYTLRLRLLLVLKQHDGTAHHQKGVSVRQRSNCIFRVCAQASLEGVVCQLPASRLE